MIAAGISGFKCFLIHSGVEEFPHVSEADLHKAMKELQGTDSVLLVNSSCQTTQRLIKPFRGSGVDFTVRTIPNYGLVHG